MQAGVWFVVKFAVYTLGCKTNQAESAALTAALTGRGHTTVDWAGPADAYIVNTCTVTAASDAKCRAVIRRARRAGPHAIVAVLGCLTQREPEAARVLGADLVLGTRDRAELPSRLEALWRVASGNGQAAADHDHAAVTPLPRLQGRTRTFMKIQDGCDGRCSYCVIPGTRGPSVSTPLRVLLPPLLALENCPEVVVTGIEISAWGQDLPGKPGLAELLAELCGVRPDIRFRVGSLEPAAVGDEFVDRIRHIPNLCPHFHLPLQSGCDATLAKMARRYNTAQYAAALARLRQAFPQAALTTDFIAGFPGEDEARWRQSLDFFTACDFASAHIFPYSRRPNTAAADLPDQNPKAVKKERAAQAAAVAAAAAARYAATCVGRTVAVAAETHRAGIWTGHAENYCRVTFAAPALPDLRRQCALVLITGRDGEKLTGALQSNV